MRYSYYTEKYSELIKDPRFEGKFMKFLEELVSNVREDRVVNVDEMITQFIDDYIKESRKKKIDLILRKKDI